MEETEMHITKWKAKYHMIPTLWHSEKGKTMETLKRLVVACVGEGEEGWTGGTQGISKAVKIFRMTVNDGCTLSHICLNPLRCTTPIMNPDKNYGLWVITMHHCRFINCNKRTPRVRDVGNGGGLYMCGAGSLSGISVPLSQCELKADLKSKVDFKREKEGQRRIKYSHTDIYNFNVLGKKMYSIPHPLRSS